MKPFIAIFTCLCGLALAGCGAQVEGDSAGESSAMSSVADSSAVETPADSSTPPSSSTVESDSAAFVESAAASASSEYADSSSLPETADQPADEDGLLSSADDIQLTDLDGGYSFSFLYDGETFQANYTPDNWKIIDSYKINSKADIIIICGALIEVHPIHGRDMESWRTPEDMADEWLLHNIAYKLLPEDSQWRENARDVDLNPEDQGKSLYEIYKDRTS